MGKTLRYRCRSCGQTERNAYPRGCFGDQPCRSVDHLGAFDDNDDDGIDVSRDDLIRLVVGMQWQTAMALHSPKVDGGVFVVGVLAATVAATTCDLRPAVDIVDEWLGVR